MPGFVVQLPRRVIVDEVITSGTGQLTGVTGWTGRGEVARYNSWTTPLPPSSSARVLAASPNSSNGTITITTGLTNPDYPRAVRVVPSTSQGQTGSVVIAGTDQFGASVTDTITLASNAAVDGVLAFKTITSVQLPQSSGGTCNVTVGLSNIFGLDRTPSGVAACIRGAVNGTAETTAPIIGAPSTSNATAPAVGTRATAKFSTAATSSAGALLELLFVPQDTTHI